MGVRFAEEPNLGSTSLILMVDLYPLGTKKSEEEKLCESKRVFVRRRHGG